MQFQLGYGNCQVWIHFSFSFWQQSVSKFKSLYLTSLKEIPTEIGQLANLSYVYLLTTIWIFIWSKYLDNNLLSTIPTQIGQLSNLIGFIWHFVDNNNNSHSTSWLCIINNSPNSDMAINKFEISFHDVFQDFVLYKTIWTQWHINEYISFWDLATVKFKFLFSDLTVSMTKNLS